MTHAIQYTTIPDMRNRLGVNVQELSLAMSLGTVGGLFGGPTASIVDRSGTVLRYQDCNVKWTLYERSQVGVGQNLSISSLKS